MRLKNIHNTLLGRDNLAYKANCPLSERGYGLRKGFNMCSITIKRVVNGKELSFELTSAEMLEAFYKKQFQFDKSDIENEIEGLREDDDFEESYGIPLKFFEPYIDEAAKKKRDLCGNADIGWSEAVHTAINVVISRYFITEYRISLALKMNLLTDIQIAEIITARLGKKISDLSAHNLYIEANKLYKKDPDYYKDNLLYEFNRFNA